MAVVTLLRGPAPRPAPTPIPFPSPPERAGRVPLYRSRASEALTLACQAKASGQLLAARGYLAEASFWHALAACWAQIAGGKQP